MIKLLATIFFLSPAGLRYFATALKCKCTQNSPKTPCVNGACEVADDSACLMLDHPSSGRHYACSMAKLKEGECTEKTTKTGASVQVCSCNSSDFCNFNLWPKQSNKSDEEDDEEWIPIPASKDQQRGKDADPVNGSQNPWSSILASTIIIPTAIYAFLAWQ